MAKLQSSKKELLIQLPVEPRVYDTFWPIVAVMVAAAVNDIGLMEKDRVIIEGIYLAHECRCKTTPVYMGEKESRFHIPATTESYSKIRDELTADILSNRSSFKKTHGLDGIILERVRDELHVYYRYVGL